MNLQRKSPRGYYQPAEDSFFMAEFLENENGVSAIDIGTGSGILAGVLSKNFDLVVATDINTDSLKQAIKTVENCVCCNSADAMGHKFDLAVCNLPYLPSDKIEDPTVDGLEEGLGVPTSIIESASRIIRKNGKLIFLTSSHANYLELIERTKSFGFSVTIMARKKLFFEELLLVYCVKL